MQIFGKNYWFKSKISLHIHTAWIIAKHRCIAYILLPSITLHKFLLIIFFSTFVAAQIFAAQNAEILTDYEVSLTQISQKPGWIEVCPIEIWKSVLDCMQNATKNLKILDINIADIVAIGVTNQRETTVLWHKLTGGKMWFDYIKKLPVSSTDFCALIFYSSSLQCHCVERHSDRVNRKQNSNEDTQ